MKRFLFDNLMRAYRVACAPILGGRCRYFPSCSEYAHEAFLHHRCAAALLMIARRIARCHPWGGCGYDPVPQKELL